MTTPLDLATVLLLHKSSFFIGALCFLYVRWQSPRSHGLGILASAFVFLAIASTLAGLGEKQALSRSVWTLSSFAIGTLGYALFWVGIRRLSRGKNRPMDWCAVAIPAALTLTALLTGFHLDNLLRGSLFQGNSILFLLASAWALVQDIRRERLSARYALAAAITVAAILALLIILGLMEAKAAPLPPRDAFFVLILCHFAIALFSLIFVKERVEAELTMLLDTDALTLIHNRRWFFSHLPATPQAGDAFIIIDIDHFKRVNDTFGHAAGDTVLVSAAGAMSQRLRRNEIFARLGGEEFGIYLPAAPGVDPEAVAESLRAAIEERTVRLGDIHIPVTISAGVAVGRGRIQIDELMSMADTALYAAKNLGRNRVERYRLPSAEAQAERAAGAQPAHLPTRARHVMRPKQASS